MNCHSAWQPNPGRDSIYRSGKSVQTTGTTSDYRPVTKSSGILSIEVFEHFTRPSLSATEKVAIHLRSFERCHDWLNRGSRLSLQYYLWFRPHL
jgi:cyclopropane fatty-acyl-phospholipid synthase-like methyltransferase